MKLILCIITYLILAIPAKSQSSEPIFTITQDTIKNNDKFIIPFFFEDEKTTSHLFRFDSITSKSGQYSYTVKLSNYEGCENDGGYFRIIEIISNNKTLLQLRQSDGWNILPRSVITFSPNKYFLTIHLNENTTALVFTGYPYNNEPELITIIVLHKNTAKLVFNQNMLINKMSQENELFCLTLHDSVIEYLGHKNANTTNILQIWKENGTLKFGGPYGIARNNFN